MVRGTCLWKDYMDSRAQHTQPHTQLGLCTAPHTPAAWLSDVPKVAAVEALLRGAHASGRSAPRCNAMQQPGSVPQGARASSPAPEAGSGTSAASPGSTATAAAAAATATTAGGTQVQLQPVKHRAGCTRDQTGVLLPWHRPELQQVPDLTPARWPPTLKAPPLHLLPRVQRSVASMLRWVKELTHGNLEATNTPCIYLPCEPRCLPAATLGRGCAALCCRAGLLTRSLLCFLP